MSWFTKISGQAIRVTPSMKEYATNAANKILELISKETVLTQKQIIFHDYVFFEIKNKKEDYIVYLEIAPQSESGGAFARGGSLQGMGRAGRVTFYQNAYFDKYRFDDFYYATLHELVHVIDPKLIKSFHAPHGHGWSAAKQPDFISGEGFVGIAPGYYNKPWEQDAFMASKALQHVKRWMEYWTEKQTLKEHVSDFLEHHRLPGDATENSWYRNKKIWHKYLNTIYQTIEREFAEKEEKSS